MQVRQGESSEKDNHERMGAFLVTITGTGHAARDWILKKRETFLTWRKEAWTSPKNKPKKEEVQGKIPEGAFDPKTYDPKTLNPWVTVPGANDGETRNPYDDFYMELPSSNSSTSSNKSEEVQQPPREPKTPRRKQKEESLKEPWRNQESKQKNMPKKGEVRRELKAPRRKQKEESLKEAWRNQSSNQSRKIPEGARKIPESRKIPGKESRKIPEGAFDPKTEKRWITTTVTMFRGDSFLAQYKGKWNLQINRKLTGPLRPTTLTFTTENMIYGQVPLTDFEIKRVNDVRLTLHKSGVRFGDIEFNTKEMMDRVLDIFSSVGVSPPEPPYIPPCEERRNVLGFTGVCQYRQGNPVHQHHCNHHAGELKRWREKYGDIRPR